MRQSYHRWLTIYEKDCLRPGSLKSASTEDILDSMESFFQQPRAHLKEVVGAWDGTPESVGEK